MHPLCRPALSDRTNAVDTSFKRSRSEDNDHGSVEKRPRVHTVDPLAAASFPKNPHPNCSVYRSLRTAGLEARHSKHSVSSRPILTSFVSSNKSDLYPIYSKDDVTMPGLPFTCAFTGEAKKAGMPILAIGTQDGIVELLNVSKRKDWEPVSQRTSLHIHDNAILDLKWSKDDRYLATASGDFTIRITSAMSQKTVTTLSAHTSSVKTLDWHPHHIDILSSGGRDGHIYVWDLRCSSKNNSDNMLAPVVQIRHAHEDFSRRGVEKFSTSKTVTSLIHLPDAPQHLVSAGSFDGKLRKWDLRRPQQGKPFMISHTKSDPTMVRGLRGRGISGLALGSSYTEGTIWGITADSCIYKYTEALNAEKPLQMALKHSNLFVKSFYVKIATSLCGKWLASGSSGGGVYIWDIAARSYGPRVAVELKTSGKEIGAVDWASDMLAACCDDGTVRIWRPDLETALSCRADPVEKKWEWAWASS